ncbi:hypothetical protein KR222_007092, partial [Zaprionus bogoriensis]
KIGLKYYYIAHNDKVNWFEAGEKCRSMGGNLVNFLNDEELQTLAVHLKTDFSYWIDLNDLGTEGEYRSTATGRAPHFIHWQSGNPNNLWNEDCVELWYHHGKYLMNDFDCNKRKAFICEAA